MPRSLVLTAAGVAVIAFIIWFSVLNPYHVEAEKLEGYGSLLKISGVDKLSSLFVKLGVGNTLSDADREPENLVRLLGIASVRVDNVLKTSCWDELHEKYYEKVSETMTELENIETVVELFRNIYGTDVSDTMTRIREEMLKLETLLNGIKREPESSYSCAIMLANAPKIINEARTIADEMWKKIKEAYDILQRAWELKKVVYVYDILVKQTNDPSMYDKYLEVQRLLQDAIKYSFSDPEKARKSLETVEEYWRELYAKSSA